MDQYQQDEDVSPILLCCPFQATKSYFGDEALNNLQLRLQTAIEKFERQHQTKFVAQTLLEQIQH